MGSGVAAEVLVGAGTLVAVLAALAVVLSGSVYRRLHFLTVLNSAAAPLIGAGAATAGGLSLTTATVLVIVLLLVLTGPVLGAAIGRVNAQRSGDTVEESPE
ncbi:monovalent cation/H(+) antiporter subunit G [Amycolatopsis taiwanensis]|uniref:Sodium:proton antiporter n=1 Tax=Amycolatopsis taiwanensis TaxID=342230 RepID=A0A9W6R622_9PSEU|nr:monovalent cation/H(+) antiporter subunit G [Amycolatopsis taiwanensis]GLY70099.1 hypothetical protein Atai01_67180 [Amycolatopsis taiwanensis]